MLGFFKHIWSDQEDNKIYQFIGLPAAVNDLHGNFGAMLMNVIHQFAVFWDMGIGVHALHAKERRSAVLGNECVAGDDQAAPTYCQSFIQLEKGLSGKPVPVAHAFMGSGSNQAVFQFQAFNAGLFEECRHGASFH